MGLRVAEGTAAADDGDSSAGDSIAKRPNVSNGFHRGIRSLSRLMCAEAVLEQALLLLAQLVVSGDATRCAPQRREPA